MSKHNNKKKQVVINDDLFDNEDEENNLIDDENEEGNYDVNIDANGDIEDDDDYGELQGDEDTEANLECQIEKMIDDDNDCYDNFENSEIQKKKEEQILNKDERISANRLTKYEMVRILGERTKQLTMGAKPLVKNHELFSYDKIAEEELKLNMIPFKIKRNLPNGKYEIWTLDELYKDHLLSLLE